MRSGLILSVLIIASVAGCAPDVIVPSQTAEPSATAAIPTPTTEPAITFPAGVNPLTGLRVSDPRLLKIPALLVSISHFPATGRPQSGLSFAPIVYEFYITEGATRFLAVFYGDYPRPELPVPGGCETRIGPFIPSGTLLGNRVWFDADGNGRQDPWEDGISGLCVNLYDANGNMIERASTDSNGFFGFSVQPGRYTVEFVKPEGYEFTKQAAVGDDSDSDAEPASGRAEAEVTGDDLLVDAGLVPGAAAPTPDPAIFTPLPQVGPVRSGRLIYSYISDYFQNSCLIYAFASEEVLERLPQCHMVFHQLAAGGYMMGLDDMQSVAEQNLHAKGSDFNYAANRYSEDMPPDGTQASLLKVYFAYQNQSGWAYDPISRSYLRYVDTSEYEQAGVLHPDSDRLTGRQLHYENVIIIFARHEVISPTNLDIHLDAGEDGKAVLFRGGQMFKISWSTAQEEKGRGLEVGPMRFLGGDGRPVPLEPGHTWVIVVTPNSKLEQSAPGQWLLNFAQPEGAK